MENLGIINKNQAVIKEAVRRGFDPRFVLYRFRWNYYPILGIVPKAPCHVDIELTNACNLRCVMCVHGQGGVKNQGFMDRYFAEYLVDQASGMGTSSLKFNWRGEATLHRHLAELIRYAKKKGILEVQLNTNGTLFRGEGLKELINSGLDRIIFSVDAATKNVYEEIRIGANFENVLEAIKKTFEMRKEMGSNRPFIRIQMAKLKINKREHDAFINKWRSFADEIRITEATDRGQGKALLCGDNVSIGRARCTQPWQRMAISWDGKVYSCCADYFEKWPIGDAKKEKLIDIWRGERLKEMREAQREMRLDEIEPCKECFWSGSYKWERKKR